MFFVRDDNNKYLVGFLVYVKMFVLNSYISI